MEVGSEQPVMPSREQFSVGVLKSPVHVQSTQPPPSPLAPVMPNMRVAYTSDGTVVYKPITTSSPSPYQGGGGGSGVLTAASGGAATSTGGSNGPTPVITPHGLNINMGEPLKRKRGRPRKYGPDGTMALTLSPVSHAVAGQSGSGGFSLTTAGAATSVSSASAESMKKARGKPPGLSKKQQMVALGSAGIGFTPHVITVKAGEDVSSKILSFSHHGPRAVCILSANGAISNVTLRQAATSGGTVTYEGRFEILSLSGSYLLSESGGQRSRTGGLSVSLAGPDGRVLGGGVAGQLTAASPVQVVVGSFIADGKRETKPMSPLNPTSATGNLTPGGMMAPSSSPSPGTQSESSGGPGSPLNQSTGACNNSSQHDMLNMSWK